MRDSTLTTLASSPYRSGDQPLRGVVRHLGADDLSSPRVRVVDAALRCVARCGLAKTTVDDVAREARISRATLYRLFPGGKEAVVRAVVETGVARLYADLGSAMGDATDLEELLVAGIVAAARHLASHEALSYLLRHEPGTILPHLAFSGLDRVLESAGGFAAPFVARWLEPEEAARASEWAARIVVSYLVCPNDGVDLTDPVSVAHLVSTFVLPGIQSLCIERAGQPGQRRNVGRPVGARQTSRSVTAGRGVEA
jgi:AcrR family transcriptional regulator